VSPMPRPSRTVATLSAALVLGAGGGAGAALAIDGGSTTTSVVTTEAAASSSPEMSVNSVYRRARQGVVDITAKSQSSPAAAFGGPESSSGGTTAEGSGFVLDKDGDIVTNQHVVDGASSLEIKFADGTSAPAKLVGSDASSDLAVVHVSGVDSSKLQPLTIGDSSKAQVGEEVVAIGSPYGLAGSLTAGVVSALGRSITSPNHYTISGAIQTDAPINHGNSGGPLLDSSGAVIGVNAQIESDSGENTGVGFAIPSNTVRSVAEQLVSGGHVSHPFLGLEVSDGEAGAVVGAVTSGSPADDAGLKAGDVVTAIDGKAVRSSAELVGAVQSHHAGDKVTLTVHRGSSTRDVSVTLGDQSASS
jgi:putative serine protease PepD